MNDELVFLVDSWADLTVVAPRDKLA